MALIRLTDIDFCPECILGKVFKTLVASFTFALILFYPDPSSSAQTVTATPSAAAATSVSPLWIVNTSLPTSAKGAHYSKTLTAAGGKKPYTWAIAAGKLPPGLSLAAST